MGAMSAIISITRKRGRMDITRRSWGHSEINWWDIQVVCACLAALYLFAYLSQYAVQPLSIQEIT